MSGTGTAVREPAVAGSFYPSSADAVLQVVDGLLARSAAPAGGKDPVAALVPHAGLSYSGVVAAAGWRSLLDRAGHSPTLVILGTNHSAWFNGVAVADAGAWRTPVGDVEVDVDAAAQVLELGLPFGASRPAHRDEHSIAVQLPILLALRAHARIVPCSVSAGTGPQAVDAGARLGTLIAELRSAGRDILLAISTDMAHYPAHEEAVRVTERLAPAITSLDPARLARLERAEAASGARGMVCGMCGIQPAVLGLAAVRAMGASTGTVVAAATSADAGGDPHRTVGYLAVSFA